MSSFTIWKLIALLESLWFLIVTVSSRLCRKSSQHRSFIIRDVSQQLMVFISNNLRKLSRESQPPTSLFNGGNIPSLKSITVKNNIPDLFSRIDYIHGDGSGSECGKKETPQPDFLWSHLRRFKVIQGTIAKSCKQSRSIGTHSTRRHPTWRKQRKMSKIDCFLSRDESCERSLWDKSSEIQLCT